MNITSLKHVTFNSTRNLLNLRFITVTTKISTHNKTKINYLFQIYFLNGLWSKPDSFCILTFEQWILLLILPCHLFLWLSTQNYAHILCFVYMFYMPLYGSPVFSYFETKNVKIINNFLITHTQLSLYMSACVYSLFFNAVIIRCEQIRDNVMGGVTWPAWWTKKMHKGFWKKRIWRKENILMT